MSIAETDFVDQEESRKVLLRSRDAVDLMITRLTRLKDDMISLKQPIEDRWLADLRRYHGKYEANLEAELAKEQKSRLFINESRAKTHSWEGRLSDMLHPVDEENWDIKPTTVPELIGATTLMEPGSEPSKQVQAIRKDAKARSLAMKAEIKDQLTEAQYNIKSRMIIHDACKIGSGIMKGPVVDIKMRKKYEQVEDTDDDGNVIFLEDINGRQQQPQRVWKLSRVQDHRPGWERIDPFSYFPDMNARNVEEAEFHFERHLLTKKQLQRLARVSGFDKDAIRELIMSSPGEVTPTYLSLLRDTASVSQESPTSKYHVWEYHGPIETEEVRAIAISQMSGDIQSEILNDLNDVDPLDEHEAVIWFCQNKILKYGPPLLETGESIYSVFNFEKDDSTMFGYGVPYLLSDSQSAMNAAWRMSMNNAGLSVAPQIVINRQLVEPQNGIWDLEPAKIWYQTKNLPFPANPFQTFHVDSRQEQLASIIGMAKGFADDEINMPPIAQGEVGTGPRQTAEGSAILMNSSNVVFRRVVKAFDDQMTIPNIRRAYDWNMAFNPKEFIKGDFETKARGSSALLVRELEAQNLMAITLRFVDHPVLGPLTKVPELYRRLIKTHMLPADDIVLTDDEVEIERQRVEAQPPPPDPEMEKLKLQGNIAQVEANTKLQIAQINFEAQMLSLAEKHNMSLEQLETKLQVSREKNQSDQLKLAAEIEMAERNPDQQSGGSV